MAHKNHALHHKKWLDSNRAFYNEYMRIKMQKYNAWKKISREFLDILFTG